VVSPSAFYRNVVGVDLLGPYNQHLTSDVGGLYLGFALVFTWAALRPGRELARAACAGFTVTQAIHFARDHATRDFRRCAPADRSAGRPASPWGAETRFGRGSGSARPGLVSG